jgi:hypothetical protein
MSKLLEFGWFQRPLWIRRVLVRAQEGQWLPRQREPFCYGLVLVRRATLPTKSLAQIGDEVFRMFEANRKAE